MKHRRESALRSTCSFFGIAVIVALWLLQPSAAFAYESIRDFQSDITVHKNGTFEVTETVVYDFAENERRGIFRYIPLNHTQPASSWYKDRVIEIDVESVSRNGSAEPYVLEGDGSEFRVKIGDANITHTGVHEYEISYQVSGGYSYYDTQSPEIYWNVTGHGWEVPIFNARAIIHDPEGIFINQKACYRGYEGEATSCISMATTSATMFSTGVLNPGEGFTVAQGLSSSVMVLLHESIKQLLMSIVTVFGVLSLVVVAVYRIKTKHKPDLPVVAEYEPYPEALPMYTGVILDGRLDGRDITAGLLHLAQLGFIKIRHLEEKVMYFFEVDDYEVELLRDYNAAPSLFHTEILRLLFWSEQVGQKVKLSSLKSSSAKQVVNAKILTKLQSSIAEDVVERGFYEQLIKPWMVILLLVGVTFLGVTVGAPVMMVLASMFGIASGASFFSIIILVIFVPIIVVATLYRRRTKLGYVALNHIKGFKDFLTVTEKDRMQFHNAPQKSPEQFMEYLPYAVALGVEKEWSEVFKDVVIESPDWYDAGASGAAFSATDLTSNLTGFSSAVAGTSGASGSSGSSGGGFSGGGSGGGGGGSW